MVLTIEQKLEAIEFDEDGFMINRDDWSKEVGQAIANKEGIELNDRHWLVIDFARQEFEIEGDAPTLRRIIQSTGVSTKEMYSLFPGGPAKMASKIAGLGKPTGCI
ncbi:MAG: TusE/DsrC/DsvC family sulfur relay protein [Chloroflexota bacterium]